MSNTNTEATPGTDETKSYETARDLAEQALDHYAHGDRKAGDQLAEKAVKTDRSAVEDVVREMEEDAQATGPTTDQTEG